MHGDPHEWGIYEFPNMIIIAKLHKTIAKHSRCVVSKSFAATFSVLDQKLSWFFVPFGWCGIETKVCIFHASVSRVKCDLLRGKLSAGAKLVYQVVSLILHVSFA